MNFNEDQLKEIESMASLFFNPEEIAINLEVDEADFLEMLLTKSGNGYTAYMKGRLKTDTDIRQAILQSALNGSSPAQQMMRDWHNRSKYE